MTTVSFALTTEPWVRVRRHDNAVVELSLVDVFGQAHQIVGLAGEVPTQDVALLRLLLAIIRRSFPQMRSHDDWAHAWKTGRFDMAPIESYLERHRDRFDLLHPETPFLQVAGLRTAKGEMTELARLVADVPAGHQYFTTRSGAALKSMTFAEAARWIVHCQAYDPSGIKSGAVGDDRVKGGKGYPIGIAWCGWLGAVVVEGANLFETLMLNLPLGRSLPDPETDVPVWERPPLGPGIDDRPGAPYGPVDLLTWPSRRIRLGHDGERATGVLIANGDPLHPRNMFRHEFMTGWRLSETQMKALKTSDPVFMPRAHVPDRAVWRGLESLLTPTDDTKRTMAGRWMEWLAELQEHDILSVSFPLRIHTTGMQYGSQSAVIDDITDDVLPLHLAVLTDPRLVDTAIAGVQDVSAAVQVLGQLASELVQAAGGDRDLAAAHRDEAREQGYAALDAPYRRWVSQLVADSDRDIQKGRWQIQVRRDVSELGRELLNSASPASWSGLPSGPDRQRPINAATAANWFYINLRKALPLAYDVPEGQVS
jgi:CRISPR system Cascade subunit CasA